MAISIGTETTIWDATGIVDDIDYSDAGWYWVKLYIQFIEVNGVVLEVSKKNWFRLTEFEFFNLPDHAFAEIAE